MKVSLLISILVLSALTLLFGEEAKVWVSSVGPVNGWGVELYANDADIKVATGWSPESGYDLVTSAEIIANARRELVHRIGRNDEQVITFEEISWRNAGLSPHPRKLWFATVFFIVGPAYRADSINIKDGQRLHAIYLLPNGAVLEERKVSVPVDQ